MNILFVDNIHPYLKKELENRNHICDLVYDKNKEQVERIIQNYDGIIIRSRFNIDKAFIDKAIKLKFIARAGSGTENIDVKYAETKNISCYNAAEGNRNSVAEHALALLLSLFNNLNTSHNEIKEGLWRREQNRGLELSGKTIGIIGYGNTGSAFANILKGFNMKIKVYDKYLHNYNYESTMKEIYKEADILSLHIPLNPETLHLVNHDFINNFKKSFYLINTARGKCVDTRSLVSALKKGKLKGACLDVLEYEEISFNSLSNKKHSKEMDYLTHSNNVILSPHIAGLTKESNIKIAQVLFEKISSLDTAC